MHINHNQQNQPSQNYVRQFYITWQIEFTACLCALAFSLLFPAIIFVRKRRRPNKVSTYLRSDNKLESSVCLAVSSYIVVPCWV